MDIKLDLTLEETNLVLQALQELPYKISKSVIEKITDQGQKQFNAQNEPQTVDLSPK